MPCTATQKMLLDAALQGKLHAQPCETSSSVGQQVIAMIQDLKQCGTATAHVPVDCDSTRT